MSKTIKTKICMLHMCLGMGIAFSQPTGTPLTDNGLLIGATAEVGTASKEGLLDWPMASNVQSAMQREFGLIQTTSYPAWGVWGGSNMDNVTFDLENTNRVINWADAQGKQVAVHLLAGSGNYFPKWLQQGTGSWGAEDLDTLLYKWIYTVMQSNDNAAKVDYWNVVNEAFTWDGYYWANLPTDANADKCPWQDMGWEEDKSELTGKAKVYAQHPKYIRRAFEIARQNTNAKLELRDYSVEFWNGSRKSLAFYQLVKHLLNSGVPLDAVGFQGHFRTDQKYDWNKLSQAIRQYKDLGLEVYITEIDYGDDDVTAAATSAHRTASYDSLQSSNLYEFTKAAASAGVDWLCLWGVADNSNPYWRMGQSALLFDETYEPKDAYYQFRQGIVDGLYLASPAKEVKQQSQISFGKAEGNVLYLTGVSSGHVILTNLSGATQARISVKDGRGILPPLPQGSYVWKLEGMEAQGLILF